MSLLILLYILIYHTYVDLFWNFWILFIDAKKKTMSPKIWNTFPQFSRSFHHSQQSTSGTSPKLRPRNLPQITPSSWGTSGWWFYYQISFLYRNPSPAEFNHWSKNCRFSKQAAPALPQLGLVAPAKCHLERRKKHLFRLKFDMSP